MKENISLDLIDFSESNIKSYYIEGDNITLYLEKWNCEILEIKFLKYAALFSMGYYWTEGFHELFQSSLLDRVLKETYESPPIEHPYRIFRFINSDDMTALEVVCEDISIRKLSKGLGQNIEQP